MSGGELAPFVAAAVRDKVVTDLYEELQAIKAKYEAVELTGKMGSPVYVSKPFSSGAYFNPMMWDVDMRMAATTVTANSSPADEKKDDGMIMDTADEDTERMATFPLRYLSQLEVRLGGMVKGIWHQSCLHGYSCMAEYKNGFARDLAFDFGMEASLFIAVDIEMDRETFDYLIETDPYGEKVVDPSDFPNFILQMCHDNARVRLRKVKFITEKLESAMKTWNIPPYRPPDKIDLSNDPEASCLLDVIPADDDLDVIPTDDDLDWS